MDSLPTPQKVSTDGDQWRNWREFREEWEDYEIGTGVAGNSDVMRVKTLKTVMGREAAGILKRLSLSAEDKKKTTKQVLDTLEKHFKPRKNEIYESFIFISRAQQSGESIQQYVSALQQLAESCEFGSPRDRLIRDRLVIGIRSERSRERLLETPASDLSKAVEMCKSAEVTKEQILTMRHQLSRETPLQQSLVTGEADVHQTQPIWRRPKEEIQKDGKECGNCGTTHQLRKCPVVGVKCRNCGRMNHFARVCR